METYEVWFVETSRRCARVRATSPEAALDRVKAGGVEGVETDSGLASVSVSRVDSSAVALVWTNPDSLKA